MDPLEKAVADLVKTCREIQQNSFPTRNVQILAEDYDKDRLIEKGAIILGKHFVDAVDQLLPGCEYIGIVLPSFNRDEIKYYHNVIYNGIRFMFKLSLHPLGDIMYSQAVHLQLGFGRKMFQDEFAFSKTEFTIPGIDNKDKPLTRDTIIQTIAHSNKQVEPVLAALKKQYQTIVASKSANSTINDRKFEQTKELWSDYLALNRYYKTLG